MLDRSRKIFFFGSVGNPFVGPQLGGQRVTVRQAETLCQWGYSAFVVTGMGRLDAFRMRKHASSLFIQKKQFYELIDIKSDVVVVPGRYLPDLDSIPGDNKVLFSQNAYVTLDALDINERMRDLWDCASLRGVFCVSAGNGALLEVVAGNHPVLVIPNYVPGLTKTGSSENKAAVVVFPARSRLEKNPWDTRVVLHLVRAKLRRRNVELHDRLEFIELSGLSYQNVMDILSKSSVLVFLGNNEGLPLTIQEAMANDVITVGFNRRSNSDVLHPSCTFEIGQLEEIADTIISILEEPDKWENVRNWGRNKLKEYTKEVHLEALEAAWSRIEEEILRAQPRVG